MLDRQTGQVRHTNSNVTGHGADEIQCFFLLCFVLFLLLRLPHSALDSSASRLCVKMSNNSPEGFSSQTCLSVMMEFYTCLNELVIMKLQLSCSMEKLVPI